MVQRIYLAAPDQTDIQSQVQFKSSLGDTKQWYFHLHVFPPGGAVQTLSYLLPSTDICIGRVSSHEKSVLSFSEVPLADH